MTSQQPNPHLQNDPRFARPILRVIRSVQQQDKMKPNLLQYIFAYDIPGRVCYIGFPIAVLVGALLESEITPKSLTDLPLLGLAVVIIVASIPLGFLLGGLFICFFLSPFYHAMVKMNGGPLQEGDNVYIIAGRHKGEVRTVYSGWQGFDVRLDIGEDEKTEFKDVYSSLSLIKIINAEQEPGEVRETSSRPSG